MIFLKDKPTVIFELANNHMGDLTHAKKIINDFIIEFKKLSKPSKENLEPIIKALISNHKTNFKGVGQPLRIKLVGSRFGPGIYDIILSLNKHEVIRRLKDL